MMKMKNLGLVGIVLLGLAFTACSKEEDNGGVNEPPRSVVITTRQINYEVQARL